MKETETCHAADFRLLGSCDEVLSVGNSHTCEDKNAEASQSKQSKAKPYKPTKTHTNTLTRHQTQMPTRKVFKSPSKQARNELEEACLSLLRMPCHSCSTTDIGLPRRLRPFSECIVGMDNTDDAPDRDEPSLFKLSAAEAALDVEPEAGSTSFVVVVATQNQTVTKGYESVRGKMWESAVFVFVQRMIHH